MHTPEYLVEVSIRIDDVENESSSSAEFSDKTMVPLSSGMRLQARDADYVCVTCCQRRLGELMTMPATCLRRIVRIVDWDEVREAVSHLHCTCHATLLHCGVSRT